jgi:hypothetical protein
VTNLSQAERAGVHRRLTLAYGQQSLSPGRWQFAVFKPDSKDAKPDQKDGDKIAEGMNKAASAYENLEPAGKVFEHIEAYVKAGKKSK